MPDPRCGEPAGSVRGPCVGRLVGSPGPCGTCAHGGAACGAAGRIEGCVRDSVGSVRDAAGTCVRICAGTRRGLWVPCGGLRGFRAGRGGVRPARRAVGARLRGGSASASALPGGASRLPRCPGFRRSLDRPEPTSPRLTEGPAPRLLHVPDRKVSSPTFSFFTLQCTWFCPQDFHFLDKCFFFSSLVLCLGVVSRPFSVSPPLLCVGVSHTPTPSHRDPCQGPLVLASLTSTCLSAKLSPQQPQPD